MDYKTINCSQQKAIIRVKIDEEEIPMEIDTGAAVSIVPRSMCKRKLESSLRSATGQLMKLAGQTVVNVQVEGETKQLKTICSQRRMSIIIWQRMDTCIFWKKLDQSVNK